MGSALPTMRESLRGSRAPLPPLGSGHQEERVVREGGAGEREPVGHGDAVLGLAAEGASRIDEPEVVAISYPDFFNTLERLGD